ncbi:hypothetical protein [Nocardioides ferulae]|uniref:hypothetical protein n=1 Tax=Nocardioides ferulae TaxID=2340821 RepID=UPI000EAD1944|nr:hypothetical protein [Nocardioides ferulae]
MLGSSLLLAARLPRVALRPVLQPATRRFDRWSVQAQQQARRNAMIASTVLAQRRAEHVEVEEFLAARFGRAAEDTLGLPPAAAPFAEAAHG